MLQFSGRCERDHIGELPKVYHLLLRINKKIS